MHMIVINKTCFGLVLLLSPRDIPPAYTYSQLSIWSLSAGGWGRAVRGPADAHEEQPAAEFRILQTSPASSHVAFQSLNCQGLQEMNMQLNSQGNLP